MRPLGLQSILRIELFCLNCYNQYLPFVVEEKDAMQQT